MDFQEHKNVDFGEADRRYAELKRQHDAGVVGDEEFDEQRRQLMVQDDEGRWWAKGRESGEWMYHDGNAWVPGTPPGPDGSTGRTRVITDGPPPEENTSGMGDAAVVPPEIQKWNWGAFLLNWIWALFNASFGKAVLGFLLGFIPLVGPIVLGLKGNEWAWREKRWNSVEHFLSTQRRWTQAGVIVLGASIVLSVVVLIILLAVASSTPARLLARLAHPEAPPLNPLADRRRRRAPRRARPQTTPLGCQP